MDGIVLLREDHRTVKQLFRDFEKTKDDATPATKRKLVDRICRELVTHSFIEETVFYPAARADVPDSDAEVLESIEEHHVVDWLLSELTGLNAKDESFDAKVSVLIENVRHHIDEEERELFPLIRKSLGRNRLAELGEEMAEAKTRAPADPLALASAKS